LSGDYAATGGEVHAIAVQNDGRILVGGGFANGIFRLHRSGSLDTASFGGGQHGANLPVFAVALQPDGRVVIGGTFTEFRSEERNRLARLTPTGLPTPGPGGADAPVRFILPQKDGYVLIGGDFTTINGEPRDRVARLFGGAAPWNQAPTDIVLSNDRLPENRSWGWMVGTISALDPDEDDVHAFSLVSGEGDDDNGLFRIQGSELRTTATLNYEEGATRSIRIRATDAGLLTVEETFLIEVVANRPPTKILLSNNTVPELAPSGQIVGSLTATDPDEGDSHTFALVEGEGSESNALFTIVGTTLRTAAVLDFYDNPVHTIRIRATDLGGLWVEDEITILVQQDPYNAWIEALPEDQRGPADDPGDHGIPNLLRYAFGMDALQPEREKLPQVGTVTVTGRGDPIRYLTLTFQWRIGDAQLEYIIEASTDLVTWNALLRPFTQIVDDGNGQTATVTIRDTSPIDNLAIRFLRVRVER
jgi:hypothetical protein